MTGARPHPSPGPLPPERPAAAPPPAAAPHTLSPASVPPGPPGQASAPGGPAREPADGGATAGGRRSRRRSPIIAPGILPALLTTVLAGLLAGAARLPLPAFAVAVVVLQAVTAAGWFRLNGMWPARQGIALAFLAGVAADAVMLLAGKAHVPTAMAATLGAFFVLNLVLHLRNRSAPDERLYALTVALTSTALTVAAGGWVAALATAESGADGGSGAVPEAAALVAVAAAGIAAATLVRAMPLPPYLSPALALAAAAGAGFAAVRAGAAFDASGLHAAGVGLAAGACALTGLRTASYDFPSRFVHMTAGVALPLALAAPAVYGLGLALG
ncbi:hypothetical protein E4198_14500 [Streptomyces sp. RKND-216]|uniref:hypothetical protein n=1 Tax=Streptomyces sp. RKND-216 TaxID=2562581 RepID=UPI00109E148B|nr:hypothetical protein [Streptomyces sp. RKND-216]THA25745.1 hypothetical protein E4198_14500 [Streptomyces sp. RKND-216]